MYKCIHCNEIISKDQFDGRIVKAGPKLYCVKCGEPVVEIPDSPTIGAGFHGAQATLISNSDNRITTNNYYGGAVDDVVETPFGQFKRSETRLCKHCKQWVPIAYFNLERGVCDDCVSKEANNSFEEGKVYMETGLYDDALSCFLQYEKICTDESDLSNVRSLIGLCYYAQEDYKNALKYLVRSCKTSSDSQYFLGEIYSHGNGVEKNYQEAVKWYRKSAEQGNTNAQTRLGQMYDNGYGVEKNYHEAVKWYRKAAELGNVDAQCFLGAKYYDGEGVEKNYQEAFKWFSKAAEQGDIDSQVILGYMYKEGLGVVKNYQEAKKWYQKAAEQGDEDAKEQLKEL